MILRDLLTATLPPFASSRKELALDADAPPLLAAFWETMGWSALFDSALAHPDRELGAARARKTLGEFVADGGTELRVRDLPRKFRLVEVDSQGVGFLFTDETDSPADPPVLGIASESSAIEQVSSSYLRHVAAALNELIFRRWYTLDFALEPGERLPGEPALRLLCPNLRRLGDDLWLPGGIKKNERGSTFSIAFRTSAALFAWLSLSPHFPVGVLSVALAEVRLAESQESELLREIAANVVRREGGWHALGSLLGQPVLARSSEGKLGLFVGRRERHALEARVAADPHLSAFARELVGKLRPRATPDVERAPALTLGIEEHRAQAREFAAWLEEIAPEHRAERAPLELEPEAPGAVAALWSALGASKIVKRWQFWPPTRAASDAAASAALGRWFEDSITRDEWEVQPGAACTPESWLPHPLRMVEAYVPRLQYDYLVPNSSHLDFADESSGALDPPVMRTRALRPRPVTLSQSYVRYVSSRIAGEFADRASAPAATTSFETKGTRICAGWFDGLYRLEPGLWFWCKRTGNIVDERDENEDAKRTPLFVFRELRSYLEFCVRLTDPEFAAVGPPFGKGSLTLTKAQRFDPDDFDAPGFRLVKRTNNEWGISGRISGAPVYLSVRKSGKSTNYRLHCADADSTTVGVWLDEQGIGFAQSK